MDGKQVTVFSRQLPLSCPRPTDEAWSNHPRVFLPLSEEQPSLICPYCGVRYVLKKEAV